MSDNRWAATTTRGSADPNAGLHACTEVFYSWVYLPDLYYLCIYLFMRESPVVQDGLKLVM